MGLLTETNAQYYSGQQVIGSKTSTAGADLIIDGWSFDTDPISAFGLPVIGTTPTRALTQILAASNFNIYFAPAATPTTYAKINQNLVYISNVSSKQITIIAPDTAATNYTGNFYIQLTQSSIDSNNGSYEYISLNDIINNFMVAYIGVGKLIPNVKRTDIMFHAKRGLQEFSYDTLRSMKSQELTIPPSLSLIMPQDYVNYVNLSWIDAAGVKHIIYPTTLTSNPTDLPLQDATGVPTQNSEGGNNLAEQSETETRWANNNSLNLTGEITNEIFETANVYDWGWDKLALSLIHI